ncbi:hypothetical protein EDC44_1582, partial [Cricetibacter osteomyelitidis]
NGASYTIPFVADFEKNTENDEIISDGFYQTSSNMQSSLDIAKNYVELIKGLVRG